MDQQKTVLVSAEFFGNATAIIANQSALIVEQAKALTMVSNQLVEKEAALKKALEDLRLIGDLANFRQ